MEFSRIGSFTKDWSDYSQTWGRTVTTDDKSKDITHTDSEGKHYVDNQGALEFTKRNLGGRVAVLIVPQLLAVVDTVARAVKLVLHTAFFVPAFVLDKCGVTSPREWCNLTGVGENFAKIITNLFFATVGTVLGLLAPGYTNAAFDKVWSMVTPAAVAPVETDEEKLKKLEAKLVEAEKAAKDAAEAATKAEEAEEKAAEALQGTKENKKDEKLNKPYLDAKAGLETAKTDKEAAAKKVEEADKAVEALKKEIADLKTKIADDKKKAEDEKKKADEKKSEDKKTEDDKKSEDKSGDKNKKK
jgi:small-conductance mechanosensitive channel